MTKKIVYCIKHPITKEPFYVGSSKKFHTRVKVYAQFPHNSALGTELTELKNAGLTPIYEVLDEIEDFKANNRRMFWIHRFMELGAKLYNSPLTGAHVRGKAKKPTQQYMALTGTFPFYLNLPASIMNYTAFKERAEREKWEPGYMSNYIAMLILEDLEKADPMIVEYDDWANS